MSHLSRTGSFSLFTDIPVKKTAYSSEPLSFLSGAAHEDLAAVIEIDLLENGSRVARELWQGRQLSNLLRHAVNRSAFWRKRVPSELIKNPALSPLPVLSRKDIIRQVEAEGSLLDQAGGHGSGTYGSSGSTGTPVTVHVGGFNGRQNAIRSLAQYFIAGRALNVPRTFIKPASAELMIDPNEKIRVERNPTWLGRFSSLFEDAPHKIIEFARDPQLLLDELKRDKVGYLACPASYMRLVLEVGGSEAVARLGISAWLHHSDTLEPEFASQIRAIGIPVNSSYSCSEAGSIGVECDNAVGHYHVTHSNVIVEVDQTESVQLDGLELGRILITHLHSYATPLIRYDVGDLGILHGCCPCGHDGPTLSHLRGRGKFFLRHPEGHLLAFNVFSARLLEMMEFKEFWIHQPNLETIVVELGGPEKISREDEDRLRLFISRSSDPVFKIEVRVAPQLDWSRNPKRLPFTSAVA